MAATPNVPFPWVPMAQFSAWSMATSVVPAGLRPVVPLVRASAACAASMSPWLPQVPGSDPSDHFVFLVPLGGYGPLNNSSHTGREGFRRHENLCSMDCEMVCDRSLATAAAAL